MSEAAAEMPNPQGVASKRERSSVEFPYMGLDEAMQVASAIHRTTGSGWCTVDQLAAELDLSMASSGFRVRLGTTKMFGLIESERGSGAYRLTDLGHRIVDPSQARAAKAQAFLNVPLYGKLVELHRGKTLPPAAALERMMAEIGVAQKQTDRARQTFERSAQTAGFFEYGRDKLVAPAVGDGDSGVIRSAVGTAAGASSAVAQAVSLVKAPDVSDPLMAALIQKLPAPSTTWGAVERKTWLELMAMAFTLAYGPTTAIKIELIEGQTAIVSAGATSPVEVLTNV
jgi:hypothetical protein